MSDQRVMWWIRDTYRHEPVPYAVEAETAKTYMLRRDGWGQSRVLKTELGETLFATEVEAYRGIYARLNRQIAYQQAELHKLRTAQGQVASRIRAIGPELV
jgi:hypothetical protein